MVGKGTAVADSEMEAVATALKNNTTVKELWFKDGHIGDKGAKTLAEMLKTNKSIERIQLGGNLIGDEGAAALAGAMAANATLQNISLRNNPIGIAGTAAFREAMKTNTAAAEVWGAGPVFAPPQKQLPGVELAEVFNRTTDDGDRIYYERARTPSPNKSPTRMNEGSSATDGELEKSGRRGGGGGGRTRGTDLSAYTSGRFNEEGKLHKHLEAIKQLKIAKLQAKEDASAKAAQLAKEAEAEAMGVKH